MIQEQVTINQLDKNTISWMRLIRSENIGPRIFHQLIKLYGNAQKALEMVPELSIKGGRKKPITIVSIDSIEKEIALIDKYGAEILLYCNDDYPKYLKEIKDAPPVIIIKGNKNILNRNYISIVGSRNASGNGCLFAYKLAQDLVQNNFGVVSGLARGIDTAAHKGSVNSSTIAVIAGGIDHIYPSENKNLYDEIAEKGLIISESPFGTIPKGRNFPQRNRIIAGIGLGTVVVEATEGSGSLITAKMALDQGREIFAVPGFPLDGRSSGTNNLIKQGANIVSNVKDIIEVINPLLQINFMNNLYDRSKDNIFALDNNQVFEAELTEARKEISKLLSSHPIALEDIISITKLRVNVVLTIVLELELADKITRYQGNRISLRY